MKTWNTVLRLSAALFLVLLPLGSCAPAGNRDNSPAPPFSLNLKDAGNSYSPFTAPTVKGSGWNLGASVSIDSNDSVRSTPFGIIIVLNTYYPLDTSSKNDDSQATKILCLDPANGSLKWARILEPASSEIGRSDTGTAQDLFKRDSSPGNPGPVVTSPNGHHLAIMVKPYLISGSSSDVGDQRMRIVVIDTETGDATRTFEVSGLVLGQVLTNDSLVVETSQHFYPAGTGILNVFSLTEAQAGPTSFRTDRWLVGATSDSLLVSSQNLRKYDRLPTTLTRISTSGEELGTVAGVTAVRDGSWVFRYQDPEAATAAIRASSTDKLSEEFSTSTPGPLSTSQVWTLFPPICPRGPVSCCDASYPATTMNRNPSTSPYLGCPPPRTAGSCAPTMWLGSTKEITRSRRVATSCAPSAWVRNRAEVFPCPCSAQCARATRTLGALSAARTRCRLTCCEPPSGRCGSPPA